MKFTNSYEITNFLFLILILILVLWIIVSLCFLNFSKNVVSKRKFYPIYVIVGQLILFAFIFNLQWNIDVKSLSWLLWYIPFFIIIMWHDLTLVNFCENCSRVIYPFNTYDLNLQAETRKTNFCPTCGNKLE